MKGIKKFFGEFKKFITRGNILDLAVGVIVGGAFTAIVTSLTNNIIRPFVNWLISLCGGKEGLSSVYTFLTKAYKMEGGKEVVDLANSIYIDWGAFVTAIIDFIIIAFTIFLIVKLVNLSREKLKEMNELIVQQSKKEVKAERKAVRMQAKAEGRKFADVWAEHEAEKKRLAEEKAKADAEAKAKAEAEALLANPTQEMLLKEILAELKKQSSASEEKAVEETEKKA